jgi:hypothetical protein
VSVSRRWPSRPPADDDDDDDDDDDARPSEKDNDTGGGRRRTSWHDPDHGCLASGARTWSGRARRLGPLPPCPALFSLFRSSLSSALPGQQQHGRLERRGRGWLLGERPRRLLEAMRRQFEVNTLGPLRVRRCRRRSLPRTNARTDRNQRNARTRARALPCPPRAHTRTHARSLGRHATRCR